MSANRKTIRASSTLSESANGSDYTTPFRSGIFTIVTTGETSTASLVVKIQGKHLDGTYYDVPGATTAAITTETTTILVVGPGVASSANASVPVPLPPVWRLVYTISGGTFAVAAYAELMP